QHAANRRLVIAPDADGDLSWPRRGPAHAKRTHCARRCGANRRRRLVQRFAGIHRIIDRARTGNPIAERLLRCDRFSDPRTWGEDGKGAVADQLEFITAIEFSAGGEVWKQYFTGSPDRSERGICRVAALTLFSV